MDSIAFVKNGYKTIPLEKLTPYESKVKRGVMSMAAEAKGQRRLFTPFIIRMLLVLFFVEFVKGALIVTILPVYMNVVLGLSAYTVGWTLALQYAGDNLFRTPMGYVIDRIGYRIGILGGVAVAGVSVWIMAYGKSSGWILLAATLLGVGTSPLWPSVIAGATAEAGEQARGKVMSVVYAAWLSGTGLGPVVINLLIRGNDYLPTFWFLLGLLAFVLAIALFLPDQAAKGRPGRREYALRTKSDSPLLQRAAVYIRNVLSSIRVSPLFYPALFLQNIAIGLLAPVLTLYAKEILHLSNAMYSLLLIFGGGITILLLYPVGLLVDRWGTRWLLHIGFLLSGASIVFFTSARSMPLILGTVGLIGVSYALIIPAWNAYIAALVPEDKRAFVWGFFLTIEGGGMVAGSIFSGRLWDTFGPQTPFFVSGGVMVVIFVLHLFISNKQPVMVR